jgi:hypothetical protein
MELVTVNFWKNSTIGDRMLPLLQIFRDFKSFYKAFRGK